MAAVPDVRGHRVRGNCCGCLYLAKALIVGEEEHAIALQWPSERGAELIADKWWDWIGGQIEVDLGVYRRIAVQFRQGSVKLVTAGFG